MKRHQVSTAFLVTCLLLVCSKGYAVPPTAPGGNNTHLGICGGNKKQGTAASPLEESLLGSPDTASTPEHHASGNIFPTCTINDNTDGTVPEPTIPINSALTDLIIR